VGLEIDPDLTGCRFGPVVDEGGLPRGAAIARTPEQHRPGTHGRIDVVAGEQVVQRPVGRLFELGTDVLRPAAKVQSVWGATSGDFRSDPVSADVATGAHDDVDGVELCAVVGDADRQPQALCPLDARAARSATTSFVVKSRVGSRGPPPEPSQRWLTS
jgi:hypothetical protein